MEILQLFFSSIFLSLLIITNTAASGGVTIIPNYDFDHTKVLDYKATNVLQCNITGDIPPDHVLQWFRNDKPIEQFMNEKRKIEVKENKLILHRPLDDDITNYTCVLINKTAPQQYVARAEFTTAGKPTAKLLAPVTVIEGEKLKLECIVTGKPAPSVVWSYEGAKLDTNSGRIKLLDHLEKGIASAYLEIEETQMSDRGEYFCSAQNIVTAMTRINSTEASTFVRVKDKLAALWPFIGICVEVIVLCTIIFVYERKRNRSELEESDTDQSPEQKNTPDHGKEAVRQRK